MLIAAAVVMVLGGVGSLVIQALNAWANVQERIIAAAHRLELTQKADEAAAKADLAAHGAVVIAQKVDATDTKLESIKNTTESSAKNVDGNLAAVREDLARQMAHSQALQQTVDSLIELIRTLQQTQQRTVRAADAVERPAVQKVEVVNEPLSVKEKDPK